MTSIGNFTHDSIRDIIGDLSMAVRDIIGDLSMAVRPVRGKITLSVISV